METRNIGSLEVSVVGLGTNNFGTRLDAHQAASVIDAALDAGLNFIDTAESYGDTKSESFIGQALGSHRDSFVLATKFGWSTEGGGGSVANLRRAVEGSLQRLATDRIDLYILHRPDAATPIEETLGGLGELVAAGKVREIGCSNLNLDQLRAAEQASPQGGVRFVNLQNRFNLLQRSPEADVLPECERNGIGFVPFSPLMSGLLTGKYSRATPSPSGTRITNMADDRRTELLSEHNLAIVEALEAFCSAHDRTLLELAFSWLLTHQAVSSVIAGASSPEQLRANVAAASWKLTDEELRQVDEIAPRVSA